MGLNHREIINIMENSAKFGASSVKIVKEGIFMDFFRKEKESFTIPENTDKISYDIVKKQKEVSEEQFKLDQEEEALEEANRLIIDKPEEYEDALANGTLVDEDLEYDE